MGSVRELGAAVGAELEGHLPVEADELVSAHSREAVVGEYLALIRGAMLRG